MLTASLHAWLKDAQIPWALLMARAAQAVAAATWRQSLSETLSIA